MAENNTHQGERPHVVVIGGGFGGLTAVRALRRADVDITLIDRRTYNTFQPLLYQVATMALNPGDITWFLRAVRSRQKNVRFVNGKVTGIDHATNCVEVANGRTERYDYLIIATGVTANFFGIPGAAQYAMPLYTRTQALALRDAIVAKLEKTVATGQKEDLRVVVVGGGPTGVETIGALAELRNNDMPVTYPEIDTSRTHLTLIEMQDSLLGPFVPKLQRYTMRSLEKRGVDVRLSTSVKEVLRDGVVDGDGNFISAGIVVWASGVTTHEAIKTWGVPLGRGRRIQIDDHLRVQGFDNVFAVGDVAVEDGERALPQLAQPAIQGGKYVAGVIKAKLSDEQVPAFRYWDKGSLATIGRSSAVLQAKGLPPIKGFAAWVIWFVVHLFYLLGGRNRLATMVNLGSKYIFWHRNHNAIVGDPPKYADGDGMPVV